MYLSTYTQHVCVHWNVRTYMKTYVHIWKRTYTPICVYLHTHNMCVSIDCNMDKTISTHRYINLCIFSPTQVCVPGGRNMRTYMEMYVHIWKRTYIYTNIPVQIYLPIYVSIYIHTRVYLVTAICVHIYIYTNTSIPVPLCICLHTHIYLRTHASGDRNVDTVYTYININVHIYIHTHVCIYIHPSMHQSTTHTCASGDRNVDIYIVYIYIYFFVCTHLYNMDTHRYQNMF